MMWSPELQSCRIVVVIAAMPVKAPKLVSALSSFENYWHKLEPCANPLLLVICMHASHTRLLFMATLSEGLITHESLVT